MLRKYMGGGEEKMDKQKKAQAAETLRTAMMALSGYVFCFSFSLRSIHYNVSHLIAL